MDIFLFIASVALCQGVRGQQYFRVKPHDMSVIAGRTAELHCHIGNRAGLVQWSKDGFLLGYDPTIPGYERYEMRVDSSKSAYTLLVHEARLDDEAEYQCQVGPGKNAKPIRSVARLTVLVPPKRLSINDLPNKSEIEVREGEKVLLQCQALTSKPATILKWFRRNIELMPEASRTTIRREGEKLYSTLSSITLYPRGDTTESTYTCEALHPGLEKPLRTSVAVGVLYPPRYPAIQGYAAGSPIAVGEHLSLVCSSTGGKPRATLMWFRNGEPLEGQLTGSGRDSTNTLAFLIQETDNNAVYSCAASNPLTTKPLITFVKLTVIFPPSQVHVSGPSKGLLGEQITVSCHSEASNPAVELGWFIDDVEHQAQESAVHSLPHGFYTISNLTVTLSRQDKDVRNFLCSTVAVPRHDKVFQNLNISVLYAPEIPEISGYVPGTELREGDSKILKCSSTAGNPPAKLRWYRAENQIQTPTKIEFGRISSIFSFQVEASDNDKYVRCEVKNSLLLEPLSSAVKLNVLFPPSNVTISISPTQPREGDTVSFFCVSGSSKPAAHILWWQEGTLFQDAVAMQTLCSAYGGSATHSHMKIRVSSSDDKTRIVCEAKNDAFQRSVQDEISLRVFYTPIFIPSNKVVELVEGRSTEVKMLTKSHPAVHTYQWSKDGIPIPPNDYSSNQSILYFHNVSRYHSGTYICIAQNIQGSASATLTINVLYPASISNVSGTTEVAEGESVRLQCSVDGNPVTQNTVTWSRKGHTQPSSFNKDRNVSILARRNISREEAGIYECRAHNGIGQPSIRTTLLRVHYRPRIQKHRVNVRVAAGEKESAEMNCNAIGYPEVTFTWSFNNSTMTSNKVNSPSSSVRQNPEVTDEWESSLSVPTIVEADYGVYTCIAGNALGQDSLPIHLVKKSRPDPPFGVEAFNISHSAVLLTWSSGFDGGCSQTFQLRVIQKHDRAITFIPIPVNQTSYHLSGLSQGTTYTVSIAASNVFGESKYTVPILFRTKMLDSPEVSNVMGFFPIWLLAAAVVAGVVVMTNVLVCIIYIRRKRWCTDVQRPASSLSSVDAISRTKKIVSDEPPPFYLSGTSVDLSDDGLNEDTFEKPPGMMLRRELTRCDWSSTLLCGRRSLEEDNCPDILKRDTCHCPNYSPHESKTEAEISSSIGAVLYGLQDLDSRDPISMSTFHSKSELPIRHTIITPKLETVINGQDIDS